VVVQPHLSLWLNSVPFDASAWKAAKDVNVQQRFDMVSDLVQSRLLIGKTTAEVEELLGKPETTESLQAGETTWYYWVGDNTYRVPPTLDSAHLAVRFVHGIAVRTWQAGGW